MSEQMKTDVLILGAGPAGIGAALEASRYGAKILVLDSFNKAGGQFWMQSDSPPAKHDWQMQQGAQHTSALNKSGSEVIQSAEVWGVLPVNSGFRVLVRHERKTIDVAAKSLVICTGAHDYVLPFPGWTLPGVITAGGGQRYAKLSGTPPGERIVVAGTGIFLLAVATSIIKRGGNVVALVESSSNRLAMMNLLLRYPDRWIEAFRLLFPVLRERVPLLHGYQVKSADGENHVESVTIEPSNRVVSNPQFESTLKADCLLVGHGFKPITEITSLLKCEHDFDQNKGGWYCKTDATTGATSLDSVFAAGEVTGVAGSKPAFLQGSLAGISAAERLGLISKDMEIRRKELHVKLMRAQSFADSLANLFPHNLEHMANVTEDLIVCRCEDITWAEVLRSWDDGATNMYSTKLWTRVGMGQCQGRICGHVISCLLSQRFSVDQAKLSFNQSRIPVRPVPLNQVHDAFSKD